MSADYCVAPSQVTRRQKLQVLFGAFLLMFLRAPWMLLQGRVYAEEGTTYLHYAWDATVREALFAPHQGYFALLPNLCSLVAARLLPLAAAGFLFPWTALWVQLLTVWLVVRCEAFATLRSKALAAAVVALATPSNDAWLNTINSQFYLAACVGVIFISDASQYRLLRTATLAVAGLTGVISCFLTPFYLVRALRNPAARLQAVILTVCTAIHMGVLFHIGVRPAEHHLEYLPEAFLVKSVVLPFLSRVPAVLLGRVAVHHVTMPFLVASFLVSIAILLLAFGYGRIGGRQTVLLLAMGLWIELLCLSSAVNGSSLIVTAAEGGRYTLPCNLLVGLALVLLYERSRRRNVVRRVTAVLLTALCVSGLLDYGLYWQRLRKEPRWSTEVARRQLHPEVPLRIAPTGWPSLQLAPRHEDRQLPADIDDSVKNGRSVIVVQ